MDNGGGYDIWRKTAALATPFNFDEVDSQWPKGHCVAVRITSENPDDGFKPTGGKVKVGFLMCYLCFNYIKVSKLT